MNIKDLEYFKNLVEQKNFSKVAAKFKVSQPTITTAIKRLENEFNAKLFIRDRRHNTIEATASGVQLFKHCQTILNELSIAQQELHNITHQKLVLGLPPIIENHYFTQVCSKLAQLNLLKSLTTVEGGSVSLTDALRKGQLDLSLLGSINPINYTDLNATEIDRQPFCIYVSKQHPLAKRKQVSFHELCNERFVFFDQNFIHNQAFNQLTQQNHFRANIIFKSNDIHILMKLIEQNLGIGFFTKIIDSKSYNLKCLHISDAKQPEFITSLVYRKNHILTPNQLKLVQVLRDNL